MSGPNEPKQPSGASKDKQLDFEQDALLDSLLFDELPAPAPPPEPTPIKLHQPLKREFSEDDVTVVGRTEDLLASLSQYEDDGTSGLEDLASSDVDQLLSSMPAASPEAETGPPPAASVPRLPDVPPAPRLPAVPRPASRLPASVFPRSGPDTTAKPPAVNPAGPPARQPFPPAFSPQAPQAAPAARKEPNRVVPRARRSARRRGRAHADLHAPGSPGRARSVRAARIRFRIRRKLRSTRAAACPRCTRSRTRTACPRCRHLSRRLRWPCRRSRGHTICPRPSVATRTSIFLQSHRNRSALRPSSELEEVKLSDPSELRPRERRRSASASERTTLHVGSPKRVPVASPEPGTVTSPEPEPELARARSARARARARRFARARSRRVRPSSIPPSIWPDERPAHDHLDGQREIWVTRAEWLENEARATSDAQAKARTLTVASEIWALVGELPRAREVAAEASAIPRAHAMAARQLRALAAADGDYKAVAPALEMEIRSAATVDARVHAAYLSAEVHRLALHDDASAKKKLDLAVRAHQDDPRAHVAKLADLLGKSNAPARVRLPESEALSELSRAVDELLRLRGAPVRRRAASLRRAGHGAPSTTRAARCPPVSAKRRPTRWSVWRESTVSGKPRPGSRRACSEPIRRPARAPSPGCASSPPSRAAGSRGARWSLAPWSTATAKACGKPCSAHKAKRHSARQIAWRSQR